MAQRRRRSQLRPKMYTRHRRHATMEITILMWQFSVRSQIKGMAIVALAVLAGLLAAPARAVELKPDTAAAFNQYIRATEARIALDLRDGRFLAVDALPERERREAYAQLRQGQIYVRHLRAEEDEKPIYIPEGLIHHWVGVVFIPGVTLAQVMAELQDYADQPDKYKPTVRKAKVLEHDGNEFKTYRQLYRKQIVTIVINANSDDVYEMPDPSHATIRSYSTRIAEVAHPDQPDERELPVGNDHGYVWRFYNYSHIEEKDGGVYEQVESIVLSRRVPAVFAWLVNPLMESIPRDVLTQLLNQTREAVLDWKARQM